MAEDPEAIEWYVTDGDSEPRGPLLPAQLRELHASGGLAGLHFSSAGFSKWLPLEVVADALGIELSVEPPLVSPRRRGEPVGDELHSTADDAVWDLLFDSRDTQWVRSYAPSLMPALAAAVAAAREVGDVAAADPLLFVASQLLRQRAKQEWQRDSSPTKYRRAAAAAQPPKHASAAVEIVASLGVDAAVAPALFLSDEPRQTALTLTRVECTERLRLAGMEGSSATVWAGLSALQRASPSPAAKIGERPPTPPPPDERRGNDLSPLFDAVADDEAARAAVATAEIAAALPQRLQSADPAERRAALNAAANLDPALLADYAADVAACVGSDDDLSVRIAAIDALGCLPRDALASHTDLLVWALEDDDAGTRHASLDALCGLGAAALASLAPKLLVLLRHSEPGVREVALLAFRRADADALANHADTVIDRLGDSHPHVRVAALHALAALAPAALRAHASDVMRLGKSSAEGRRAAARVQAELIERVRLCSDDAWEAVREAATEAAGAIGRSLPSELGSTVHVSEVG